LEEEVTEDLDLDLSREVYETVSPYVVWSTVLFVVDIFLFLMHLSICFHYYLSFQYIEFPECIEKFFQDCLNLINADLANMGLSTVELVVHEKRNLDQDGYNKVRMSID
jgi:hypothetical protein